MNFIGMNRSIDEGRDPEKLRPASHSPLYNLRFVDSPDALEVNVA
jgi:hypothetical protein